MHERNSLCTIRAAAFRPVFTRNFRSILPRQPIHTKQIWGVGRRRALGALAPSVPLEQTRTLALHPLVFLQAPRTTGYRHRCLLFWGCGGGGVLVSVLLLICGTHFRILNHLTADVPIASMAFRRPWVQERSTVQVVHPPRLHTSVHTIGLYN